MAHSLVYKLKKIMDRTDFSDHFQKVIIRYRCIGYNSNAIYFILFIQCFKRVAHLDVQLFSQVSYRFLALGCFPANLVSDVVCVLFVLRVGSLKG